MFPISAKIYGVGSSDGLPGVKIKEAGTANSTVTNGSGSFTIVASSPVAFLEISALGYVTKKVLASSVSGFVNLNPVNISVDDLPLDEVPIFSDQRKDNLVLYLILAAAAGIGITYFATRKKKPQPQKVIV